MNGPESSRSCEVYLPDIELHEPVTLEEVAETKKRYAPDVRLLAGGTELLVDLKAGRVRVGHVVSLKRAESLRGISRAKETLRIGALATLTELGRADLVRDGFASILDAASRIAGPQIRNVATVGGNLACAVPCADLPPILIAMNASVVLWSPKSERNVPLETLIVHVRKTIIGDEELLTEVQVPEPVPGQGAAYARFSLREGNAIAVGAVAAGLRLEGDGTIRDARVVLGAVAPIPKLVLSARDHLAGQPADDNAFEHAARLAMEAAEPISDVRGSADFRREVVGVLAQRALKRARQRAVESMA
jgi:carbon-monoxide dehydrogenase medium subunit